MYLVKVSFYKPKGGGFSVVEAPAFFREDNTIEEVKDYLDKTHRNVATIYIEYLPELDPSDILS